MAAPTVTPKRWYGFVGRLDQKRIFHDPPKDDRAADGLAADGWVAGFVTEIPRASGYSPAPTRTFPETMMGGTMIKLLLALLPLGASLLMLATVQ